MKPSGLSLTTKTRLFGALFLLIGGFMYWHGADYGIYGKIPVRWVAVPLILFFGLPWFLLPKVFDESARKMFGGDGAP